jgi:AcrR family transcriptional regulator
VFSVISAIFIELDYKIKIEMSIECDTALVSVSPAPMGRRDRRKAEARQRLLAAAHQLIAENGVSDLRIGDVTDLADLGFGTFYTYFPSKEALIEAVVADVLAGLAARIGGDALEFTDPAEAASASYRRFLRFSRDEPEVARVLVELDRVNAIFEDAVTPWAMETLSRGRKSGRFAVDDLDLALTSITGAALAAIRAILAGRIPPGPKTESRGAEMMLRGFGLDVASAREIARRRLP